ncbi:MAG: FecR family protein, partial [Prolixibacteraceae bacterium]|nr:FecR family protein [Prolixibacteraceae bacterium]
MQVQKQIKLFLEGKLKQLEEKELLSWIKKSPGNKNQFHKYQKIFGMDLISGNHDDTEHGLELFRDIIGNQIDKKNSEGGNIREFFYNLLTSRAAAFFAGLLVSLLIIMYIDKPDSDMLTEQKITAPYGARTQFILPDSSIVWLNSGSELIFPAHFSGSRPVTLKGEAFFQVKEANSSFLVETAYGAVEVKGTSFNVKAYPDDLFET